MQAIKEKLNDMSAMRHAKAEAKEVEKAEKELAKTRVEVAHEVRMAREAEAAMDLHVNKAADKVAEVERKYQKPTHGGEGVRNPNCPNPSEGYTTDQRYSGPGAMDPSANAYGGNAGPMERQSV